MAEVTVIFRANQIDEAKMSQRDILINPQTFVKILPEHIMTP